MLNFQERTRRITRHTKVIIIAIGIISITCIAMAIFVFTDLLSITSIPKHEHDRTTLSAGMTSYGRHQTPHVPTATSADKRWRWFHYNDLQQKDPLLDKTALLWKGQRDFVSQAEVARGRQTIRTIEIFDGEKITIENTEKEGGSYYDWEIVYLGDCEQQGKCKGGTKYWSQVKKMGDEYIGPHYTEDYHQTADHGVLIDYSRETEPVEPGESKPTWELMRTLNHQIATRGEGPLYALIKKEHPIEKAAATAAAHAVVLGKPESTGFMRKARNFGSRGKKYLKEKAAPTVSQKAQVLSGGWRFVCLLDIRAEPEQRPTRVRVRRNWK